MPRGSPWRELGDRTHLQTRNYSANIHPRFVLHHIRLARTQWNLHCFEEDFFVIFCSVSSVVRLGTGYYIESVPFAGV